MRAGPDELRAALLSHRRAEFPALPGRTNHLRAGVLVPLIFCPEPVAILTLRASGLRSHAGEVSFPGGKPEPGDAGLEDTALREAREELGISGARVLGRLSSVPLYTSDYRLEPFVAEIPEQPFAPEEAEVARVLRQPLREILERPHIEGLPYQIGEVRGLSPLFFPEGFAMYGGTAHAFLELLSVCAPLFGLPLPPLVPGALRWEDLLGRS